MYGRSYWISQGQVTDFRTTCWEAAGDLHSLTPTPISPQSVELYSFPSLCCQFWCSPSITITDLCQSPSSHIQMLYHHPTLLFCFLISFVSSVSCSSRLPDKRDLLHRHSHPIHTLLLTKKKNIKAYHDELSLFWAVFSTIGYSEFHSLLQKML